MSVTIEVEPHILQKYDIKKRLGKGAYGIVWKAVDKQSGEVVALKKIFDAFRNQTDAQRTYREIIFLHAFGDNTNVVKLLNLVKAENDKDIYLVFEFMDTDLHNVIKRGNILKDIHKKYVMYQLCKVTKYLHSGNVIHRDLKPSNVLLDTDCFVKLCDFGLARSLAQVAKHIEDVTDPALTEYVATRWYRAPEILLASHRYTKGVDMWSLGCILAEMLMNRPIFPGSSTLNQIERILQVLPQPTREDVASVKSDVGAQVLLKIVAKSRTSLHELIPNCDPDAIDLLQKLLVFNPDRRITAEDACRHPYVRRFHVAADEVTVGHDVTPPLDDDTMVSISEYRSKLYDMSASLKFHSPTRKPALAHNENAHLPPTQSKVREVQSAPVVHPAPEKAAPPPSKLPSRAPTAPAPAPAPPTQVARATVTHQSQAAGARNGAAEVHSSPKTQAASRLAQSRPLSRTLTQTPSNSNIPRSRSVSKLPGAPSANTFTSIAGNPQVLRDMATVGTRAPQATMTRTQSGSYGSRVNSAASAATGKRQFGQSGNQPSAGNAKQSLGSYSQAFGTVSAGQLQSLLGRKPM